MRSVTGLIFFFFCWGSLGAQNLIVNPGLEEKDTFQVVAHPRDSFCLNHVAGWFNPYFTSTDFFNADGMHKNVGSHLFANRIKPHSGNCYGGFYVENGKWKEYVGVQFTQPLVAGKNYRIEMYLCLSNKSKLGCNNLEIDFSDTVVSSNLTWKLFFISYPPLKIPNTAQKGMVGNWVKFSVDFTAIGGERSCVLGYLDDYLTSTPLQITAYNQNSDNYAYYYIDDVSLIEVPGAPIPRATPTRPVIYFDVDKAIIKPVFFPDLDNVVLRMKKEPALKIELRGFTDVDGTNPDNQKLSEARAKAVADYLIAHGADPKRITTKGFAETRPVGADKAMNRRVEFFYYR